MANSFSVVLVVLTCSMQHKVINVHVMIINKAQLYFIDVRHLQSIAASDLMVWRCHPFAERIRKGLAMVWFVLGRRGVYCSRCKEVKAAA